MSIKSLNIENFPIDFNWYNDQFPPLDALTYWHYLNKAKKVIEIGCGFSTYLAHKSKADLIAIDPSPRTTYTNVEYIYKQVQEVDVLIFEKLNKNDILFIDSSHIYEQGSDVYFLINEVLPRIKKGVLVHFHDFFGHHNYPPTWKEIEEMKNWNENQYVIPLLKEYEVLSFNYNLSLYQNDKLKEKYSFVPDDITQNLGAVKGASLWLKK